MNAALSVDSYHCRLPMVLFAVSVTAFEPTQTGVAPVTVPAFGTGRTKTLVLAPVTAGHGALVALIR